MYFIPRDEGYCKCLARAWRLSSLFCCMHVGFPERFKYRQLRDLWELNLLRIQRCLSIRPKYLKPDSM